MCRLHIKSKELNARMRKLSKVFSMKEQAKKEPKKDYILFSGSTTAVNKRAPVLKIYYQRFLQHNYPVYVRCPQ